MAMPLRNWVGSVGAMLGALAMAGGCGGTVIQDFGEGGAGGASGGSVDDRAGTSGVELGVGVSAGGSSNGGHASAGGSSNGGHASAGEHNGGAAGAGQSGGGAAGQSNGGAGGDTPSGGGGAAGEGGESGTAGAAGADDVPSRIERCLANLVGPATADVVSVHGHAGALGAVDYVIAGYSAGASGADGLQRFTNSYYGQVGTPAGISDTGLWMWTQHDPVVIGKVYTSGYDVPGSAQLSFRIFAQDYTVGLSCPSWGSGHFTFTAFQTGSLLASGGYDFQCPEADIDVSGCFRYAY